jgi:hypothetical protein
MAETRSFAAQPIALTQRPILLAKKNTNGKYTSENIEIQRPMKGKKTYSEAPVTNVKVNKNDSSKPSYDYKKKDQTLALAEVKKEQAVWQELEDKGHLQNLYSNDLACSIHGNQEVGKETRKAWQKFNKDGMEEFLKGVSERQNLEQNAKFDSAGNLVYDGAVGKVHIAQAGYGMEGNEENLKKLNKFYTKTGLKFNPSTGGIQEDSLLKPTKKGSKYRELGDQQANSVLLRNEAQQRLNMLTDEYKLNEHKATLGTTTIDEANQLKARNRQIKSVIDSQKQVFEIHAKKVEEYGSEMERTRESIMGISTSAPSQRQPAPPATPTTPPVTEGTTPPVVTQDPAEVKETKVQKLIRTVKENFNIDVLENNEVTLTDKNGKKVTKQAKDITDEELNTAKTIEKTKEDKKDEPGIFTSWAAWFRGVKDGKVVAKGESSTGGAKIRTALTAVAGLVGLKSIWNLLFPPSKRVSEKF